MMREEKNDTELHIFNYLISIREIGTEMTDNIGWESFWSKESQEIKFAIAPITKCSLLPKESHHSRHISMNNPALPPLRGPQSQALPVSTIIIIKRHQNL